VSSVQVIVDTLNDYFNDDITGHISVIHSRKLALETLQKLIPPYIEAMFTKKQSFDAQVAARVEGVCFC